MASLMKVVSQLSSLSLKPAVVNKCTNPGKLYKATNISRCSSTLVNASQSRQLLAPRMQCPQTRIPQPIAKRFPLLHQCRTYKARTVLKLRCSSCFFVRRQNRLFVECKAKPRHKQMQLMAKRKLFKDDYTKGDFGSVRRACFHRYKHDRYYELGNSKFGRHNWLEGKLGVTL